MRRKIERFLTSHNYRCYIHSSDAFSEVIGYGPPDDTWLPNYDNAVFNGVVENVVSGFKNITVKMTDPFHPMKTQNAIEHYIALQKTAFDSKKTDLAQFVYDSLTSKAYLQDSISKITETIASSLPISGKTSSGSSKISHVEVEFLESVGNNTILTAQTLDSITSPSSSLRPMINGAGLPQGWNQMHDLGLTLLSLLTPESVTENMLPRKASSRKGSDSTLTTLKDGLSSFDAVESAIRKADSNILELKTGLNILADEESSIQKNIIIDGYDMQQLMASYNGYLREFNGTEFDSILTSMKTLNASLHKVTWNAKVAAIVDVSYRSVLAAVATAHTFSTMFSPTPGSKSAAVEKMMEIIHSLLHSIAELKH
eukprot:Nk52_evm15s247 gene=Nk52_evmTU15s247